MLSHRNMTNVPEGALTPNLKNVEVTVQNKFHFCKKFIGQIQVRKSTKSNNSKSTMPRVMVFVHCTFPQCDRSAYEISIQLLGYLLSYADTIKEWKWTNDNNSKSIMPRVMVLMHCTFFSMRSISLWNSN